MEPLILPTLSDYESPRVLIVGCGNSRVGEKLYDSGYHDVTCVDASTVVIAQMKYKYRNREGLRCKLLVLLAGLASAPTDAMRVSGLVTDVRLSLIHI